MQPQTEDRNLLRLFERYRYSRFIENQSKTWFQQQVLLLAKKPIMPGQLFKQEKTTTNILPGNLYLFFYDPKYKDELPYYDRFPLVFPYRKIKDGFMGLNMHYLPPYWRVRLLQRLMDYANNKLLDNTTKLQYSWALINQVSKFDIANACVKHYLNGHVRSQFIQIKPSDWHTAMMLPTERFIKADKSDVWEDNKKWLR